MNISSCNFFPQQFYFSQCSFLIIIEQLLCELCLVIVNNPLPYPLLDCDGAYFREDSSWDTSHHAKISCREVFQALCSRSYNR